MEYSMVGKQGKKIYTDGKIRYEYKTSFPTETRCGRRGKFAKGRKESYRITGKNCVCNAE